MSEITTIGKLKEALKDLPEDRLIFCQTVGTDGSAWNMFAEFVPYVKQCSFSLIQLKHPEIESLKAHHPDKTFELTEEEKSYRGLMQYTLGVQTDLGLRINETIALRKAAQEALNTARGGFTINSIIEDIQKILDVKDSY